MKSATKSFLVSMLLSSSAAATPLQTIGTFCGLFPDQCMKGTESLMAVRGTGTNAYYVLEADPTTGSLPVNVTGGTVTASFASVGLTGAAVPTSADYSGLNNGGNLIGAVGDSSGRTIVAGAGTAGASVGGVLSVQGIASGTAVPVSGTFWQATQPVSGTFWQATQPISGAVTVSGTATVSGTVAASNFPSTVAVNSGAVTSSTIRVIAASDSTLPVGRSYGDSVRYTYVTAAVTTAAWVQMIASTAAAINCIELFDSSGQTLELGVGGAGSEVVSLLIPPGGLDGCVPLRIPASSRVSLKALSATTGVIGEFDLTGFN